MGYKNPHDPRRLVKDFNYMNTERGYVTRMISTKFKPSYVKYGGHIPAPSIDKMEVWRLYMNHIVKMKEKFPESNGRICAYCEQPFTFITRMGTRGKGYQGRKGQHKTNVSIDRWDPRLTYQANNIIFSCVDCNDKKRNSNPNDWVNYIRVGKEKIDD
jgi:hypothetical protein|tara:strand:+ start:125 stop:598 length:474 start_codon:yes stop_codon:yes gene_type:complete